MIRVRVRGFIRWVAAPVVVLFVALAGFRFCCPKAAQAVAAYCGSQLLIRTLALRAGTGWAGEGFRLQEDVEVAMRDGVRLSTDIYLPESPGPHPAIAIRTPYTKREAKLIGEFFARYGYAVAVQDTRGRHGSGASSTRSVRRSQTVSTLPGGFGNSGGATGGLADSGRRTWVLRSGRWRRAIRR